MDPTRGAAGPWGGLPARAETRVLPADQALPDALALLRVGEVVAIPTETVYGLAGDATRGDAVARIFEAKGRPSFNPLIVHVSGMAMADTLGRLDPLSRCLAEQFWPGPLTLVVSVRPGSGVHPLALAGLATVALRQPIGFAGELIAALGRPLAAPSANASGRLSPTTAAAAAASLAGRVPLVVDGGASPVGVESTIVKVEGETLRLLRPGGIAAEEIEAAAGMALRRGATPGSVQAPGMMASHYAPQAPLRLDAASVRPGEALLAFGARRAEGAERASAVLNLSDNGDVREAAVNLFSHLKALDESSPPSIAAEPVPETGLGEAINDRLRRAAAPRD